MTKLILFSLALVCVQASAATSFEAKCMRVSNFESLAGKSLIYKLALCENDKSAACVPLAESSKFEVPLADKAFDISIRVPFTSDQVQQVLKSQGWNEKMVRVKYGYFAGDLSEAGGGSTFWTTFVKTDSRLFHAVTRVDKKTGKVDSNLCYLSQH